MMRDRRQTGDLAFWKKMWQSGLTVALVMIMTLSFWLPFQPASAADPLSDIIKRVITLINPGSSRTAPTGRSSGGAGRGPLCPAFLGVSAKALVPTQSGSASPEAVTTTEFVWGRTIESNPTLWFYVPYAAKTVKTAKFALLDEAKQIVPNYPLILPLAETPGIIAVHLPEPLEVDKFYNWYLSIVCSMEKPSRNPGVRGWIQRIAPSAELSASLDQADTKSKYPIYAENGIWYDMITNLVNERQRYPGDPTLEKDWTALLEYLNASELKDVAIANCCKPSTP